MAARFIDRDPPVPSGNPQADIRALYEYIFWLREQVNFILAALQNQ